MIIEGRTSAPKYMLTEGEIAKAEPEAKLKKLNDGWGLYLAILPNGRKYWRFDYVDKYVYVRRTRQLGAWPEMDLQAARVETHRLVWFGDFMWCEPSGCGTERHEPEWVGLDGLIEVRSNVIPFRRIKLTTV